MKKESTPLILMNNSAPDWLAKILSTVISKSKNPVKLLALFSRLIPYLMALYNVFKIIARITLPLVVSVYLLIWIGSDNYDLNKLLLVFFYILTFNMLHK